MALSLINRYLKEREGRKARILVLTASGAASAHYMNYMNGFFTAQRLGVPIDCCVLERDSGLLQQGSDITGMCHPINTCHIRDHPFKTSACLRGGGGSPLPMFADARGGGVLGLPTSAINPQ